MSALNKFMSLKKRNGKWSIARLTTLAVFVTSMIVAGQKTWPYVISAVRPWVETPDKVDMVNSKVDALNVKVDQIAERLGMNVQPKPPENPFLPPKLKAAWQDLVLTNAVMAQSLESTNRTKL